MKTLTTIDLDILAAGGCQLPDCKHEHVNGPIFFHCRQHQGGRLNVYYVLGSGTLQVECYHCHSLLAAVEVRNPLGTTK
jgi:hypothetical protein